MCFFFCTSNKASFEFFSSNSLSSSKIVSEYFSVAHSVILSFLPQRQSELLVFPSKLHFLHQFLTAPFQLQQSFKLCIPPRKAGDVHLILSLPEDQEELLASLIPCLFGNLHDRKTCFFQRFQLLFQLTHRGLLSFLLCLLGVSAFF